MMNFKRYLKEAADNGVKKLVLLTSKPEGEMELFRTAEKLMKEAKKIKLKTYVVYNEYAWITKDTETGEYFIHNKDDKKGFHMDKNDTIIMVRGSSSRFKSTLDIISQLEKANFYVINRRDCIEICSDKFRTVLRLTESNIAVPKTRIIRDVNSIDEIVEDFKNKFPLILKTITGSKGIGVLMVKSLSDMTGVLQLIWKVNPDVEMLVQEYIKSDRDYRIHVLNGEVIASMERIRKTADFRTNYSLGNDVKNIPVEKLPEEMKIMAIKSAKAVDSIWCGVDIIANKKGDLFVIEVNSSPGTSGIELNTNLNLCKTVLESAMNKETWNITPLEIGWKEWVEVEGLGKIASKFDTGNGSISVIHADKWEVKDGFVLWEYDSKKLKNKLLKMKKVKVGGLRDYEEERPVIELDIKFNGILYTDVLMCLDGRKEKGRLPILFNRDFIHKINATINPNKKYTILQDEDGEI